jgi:hypothetical protein
MSDCTISASAGSGRLPCGIAATMHPSFLG